MDVLDVYGYSPLHHAAAEKKLDAVAALLTHGANMICRTHFSSSFYPLCVYGAAVHALLDKHMTSTYKHMRSARQARTST